MNIYKRHRFPSTNGTLLMATAAVAPYIKLSLRLCRVLFWCSLTYAWLFTLPAAANAIFETRGLAFGGGPFEGSLQPLFFSRMPICAS